MHEQDVLRKLVERHVLACASMMVYELANTEGIDRADFHDDLMNLCVSDPPDTTDAERAVEEAEEAVEDAESDLECRIDELRDQIEPDCDPGIDDEIEDLESELKRLRTGEHLLRDTLNYAREILEDLQSDGEREILEHWIVDEGLGERLREKGEKVGELFGLTIWGRTCSGQAILLDEVIHEIAKEMEILPGQKYEWKD